MKTPIDVKQIRDALELTQEQLAHRLGVSYPTVNRWENGKTKPSPLAVEKLSRLAHRSLIQPQE